MDEQAGEQTDEDRQRGRKRKPRITTFHCYSYSNGNLLKGYAGVKHDPLWTFQNILQVKQISV